MGGDSGPEVLIQGAIGALKDSDDRLHIVLIGDQNQVRPLLHKHDPGGRYTPRCEIVHAAESVAMDEEAAASVRRKKESSLAIGMRMMKEGSMDALFSAGSTGATVAAALLSLGRIAGVSRPALATLVPADTPGGSCLLLDIGATADCKPLHLQHFALMGDLYARHVMGVATPRVGLLNIGEESSKGNELAVESHKLLKETPIHFIGNVEGRDILKGSVDVVVTDGFTGNVVLKFIESIYAWMGGIVRRRAERNPFFAVVGMGLKSALKKRVDPDEYGGAPLLGVNGVCIIGHGRTSPLAVKNGVGMARRFVENGLNQQIQVTLGRQREQHVG